MKKTMGRLRVYNYSEEENKIFKKQKDFLFCLFMVGLIITAFISVFLIHVYFEPQYQYQSFTKAYNSRCDYYIECQNGIIKNMTLMNCIPLQKIFTCD